MKPKKKNPQKELPPSSIPPSLPYLRCILPFSSHLERRCRKRHLCIEPPLSSLRQQPPLLRPPPSPVGPQNRIQPQHPQAPEDRLHPLRKKESNSSFPLTFPITITSIAPCPGSNSSSPADIRIFVDGVDVTQSDLFNDRWIVILGSSRSSLPTFLPRIIFNFGASPRWQDGAALLHRQLLPYLSKLAFGTKLGSTGTSSLFSSFASAATTSSSSSSTSTTSPMPSSTSSLTAQPLPIFLYGLFSCPDSLSEFAIAGSEGTPAVTTLIDELEKLRSPLPSPSTKSPPTAPLRHPNNPPLPHRPPPPPSPTIRPLRTS